MMKQVIRYKCSYCGKKFEIKDSCRVHEIHCSKSIEENNQEHWNEQLQILLSDKLSVYKPLFKIPETLDRSEKLILEFHQDVLENLPEFQIVIGKNEINGLFIESVFRRQFSDQYGSTIIIIKSIVQNVINRFNLKI